MMEDMKNLLIQALETRGVLGQIRAKLRSSVFKIVDDQDQKFNMGCGLKWENPTLYKVSDTKVGLLSAEIIREFMEVLKMDYSLSVFIPECSISPERINKEEIFAKLGLRLDSSLTEIPVLYMLIYHFLFSVMSEPNKVSEIISTIKKDEVENISDRLISDNLKGYYENNYGGGDQLIEDNDGFVEKQLEVEEEPQHKNQDTGNTQGKISNIMEKQEPQQNSISSNNDENKASSFKFNQVTNQITNNTNNAYDNYNDFNDEEIEEDIINDNNDESFDKSKKLSGTNVGVSQSGGLFDKTVDDKALSNNVNYFEPIKKT